MRSPLNAVPPERDALVDGAVALGVRLDDVQAGRLLDYLTLIDKWNRVYNLTAIRDPAEMLSHHVLDSLTVVAPLDRECPAATRLLDVGSGAGLPGVVLAVTRPQWQVTCIDAVAKKAAFIRQVAADIGLPNLAAVHGRVEKWQAPAFDVIASRAYASLADFTRQTRHLAGPATRWLAMKGRRPDGEIAELPNSIAMFHVEQTSIPGVEAERCLVWMKMAAVSASASVA